MIPLLIFFLFFVPFFFFLGDACACMEDEVPSTNRSHVDSGRFFDNATHDEYKDAFDILCANARKTRGSAPCDVPGCRGLLDHAATELASRDLGSFTTLVRTHAREFRVPESDVLSKIRDRIVRDMWTCPTGCRCACHGTTPCTSVEIHAVHASCDLVSFFASDSLDGRVMTWQDAFEECPLSTHPDDVQTIRSLFSEALQIGYRFVSNVSNVVAGSVRKINLIRRIEPTASGRGAGSSRSITHHIVRARLANGTVHNFVLTKETHLYVFPFRPLSESRDRTIGFWHFIAVWLLKGKAMLPEWFHHPGSFHELVSMEPVEKRIESAMILQQGLVRFFRGLTHPGRASSSEATSSASGTSNASSSLEGRMALALFHLASIGTCPFVCSSRVRDEFPQFRELIDTLVEEGKVCMECPNSETEGGEVQTRAYSAI